MRPTILLFSMLLFYCAVASANNALPTKEADNLISESATISDQMLRDAQSFVDQATQVMNDPKVQHSAKGLVKKAETFVAKQPLPTVDKSRPVALEQGLDLDALISRYKNPYAVKEEKKEGRALPSLMTFVSAAMPSRLLETMATQTHKAGGSLVIKGFVGGKLSTTLKFVQPLSEKTGVNVLIDPNMFSLFQVSSVPEIIVTSEPLTPCDPNGKDCSRNVPKHDRMKGNVTLYYALEQFSWEGESADKALEHLSLLQSSAWNQASPSQ